jgi:hypothetical protein
MAKPSGSKVKQNGGAKPSPIRIRRSKPGFSEPAAPSGSDEFLAERTTSFHQSIHYQLLTKIPPPRSTNPVKLEDVVDSSVMQRIRRLAKLSFALLATPAKEELAITRIT